MAGRPDISTGMTLRARRLVAGQSDPVACVAAFEIIWHAVTL
jgi:hypothetical protein